MVDILRNKWGFKGYVTSDCGAVTDFWKTHKVDVDSKSASARAVDKGTDLECGEFWDNHWTYKSLMEAVNAGLIYEKKLDESVRRLFLTRMKLGMFDSNVSFDKIPYTILNDPAHKEHALKMARQSMVLLKNNGLLPLSKNIKSIAVIGPNADNEEVLLGNYNGIPQELVTVLAGIKEKLAPEAKVIFDQGVDYTQLIEGKSIMEVAGKASAADVIIFAGGINSNLEGEEGYAGKEEMEGFYRGDRTTIALPKIQTELMKALKSTGKPVVFVNMSGSAMGMTWESENVDAIIQAWYGGQSAGTAIADVLFGDYNPSGRLPVTFYRNDLDLPDFSDYNMTNRTYRYFKGKPLYEFGYGLSYTTFVYRNLRIPEKAKSDQTITLSVEVQNTGKTTGEEVVQLYVSGIGNQNGEPARSLKGFQRVNINPGEKKVISFEIDVLDMGGYELHGNKMIRPGRYLISIGGGQPSDFNLKNKIAAQSEIVIE
jgi:beta-glucosidase